MIRSTSHVLILTATLALLWGAGVAVAELVPTGPSSWTNTETGKTSRAFWNAPTPPAICYQDTAGTWQFIEDDWQQIGQKQAWKNLQGPHRMWCDSTGQVIYAKWGGGQWHYLGMKPPILIKFNKADSSYDVLATMATDSISVAGGVVTFHDAFTSGIDVQIVNRGKVFQNCSPYRFIFHQAGRDTLGDHGPWGNRMVGTSTRLVIDSLNVPLRNGEDTLVIDENGVIIDGPLGIGNLSNIMRTYLYHEDSVTTIPIRKRLVLIGGNPYLIELFDAADANALPNGVIAHDATFGPTEIPASTGNATIENTVAYDGATPSTSGTLDSLTAYVAADVDHEAKLALYNSAYNDVLDSVAQFTISGTGTYHWESHPVIEGVSITGSTEYYFAAWSEATSGYCRVQFNSDASPATFNYDLSVTFGSWPASLTKDFESTDDQLIIYGTYTESAAGATPSRRRRLLTGSQ